jgi:hypothetical protein
MNYLQNYEDFINEGIFGDILGFLKNVWKKTAAALEKLENDPNKIKDFIIQNTFNVNSDNNIFKTELDKFKQDKTVDNDKSFQLIKDILDKKNGILGDKGIGLLFNDKSLQGDKMKVKRLTFQFIINTSRDQIIKKIGFDKKENTKLGNNGFIDKNYLPTFKKMLEEVNKTNTNTEQPNNAASGEEIKKDSKIYNFNDYFSINEANNSELNDKVIEWVKTNIINELINNVKAIKEDDINNYVKKGGGVSNDYKVGDVVTYKRNGFKEGVDPKTQPNFVASNPIIKIEGDNYIFKDKNNAEFTKTKDQIIGKTEGNDSNEAPVVDDLKKKLGDIKNDKEKMATINKLVDFINTPENKAKIDAIINNEKKTNN